MIPAYNKMRCAAFPFETGIHFRRKTDFFPEEDTAKSYSGFEPEPTRLQAEVLTLPVLVREEFSLNSVRNRCLHLATGRTRDDIKRRIWQGQRRKGRNGGERESGGEENRGCEK
ncbi:poly polymerase [Trichonephila clavipes]|nr:poly polymerase [Trichonephila clavipes]